MRIVSLETSDDADAIDSLVTPGARNLLAILVKHRRTPSVVGTTEIEDLSLPVSFLSHELVDLVIQVSNLVVGQTS